MTEGVAHPTYHRLASTFRRQLEATSGGAALAVYHRGELVVDLWGGARTPEGDPWERDTLAMCFSTTKGAVSTALHLLADRGKVDYEEPVATYWPEFAQAGKAGVLVRHVLTHSAGLHRMRTLIDHAERMLDWDHMVDALARAEPAYEPGTQFGYHALTYGWLAGEIVRRVSGRPLERFIEDELAVPLELDGFHLGCPEDQRHRVAPLRPMRPPPAAWSPRRGAQFVMQTGVERIPSLLRLPVNPRRMRNALAPRGIEEVLWGADVMDAAIPAANGFFTARSLARMYAMLAGEGTSDAPALISPQTLRRIATVHGHGMDRVLVVPMDWRLGFHRVFTTRGALRAGFGHFGFGGSGAWADPKRGLAIAMVCNRGSGTPIGDVRMAQLGTAAIADADARAAASPAPRSGRADERSGLISS